MMDVTYINAFISAIENVFATMLQTDVLVKEPSLKADREPRYDVSGIIGMSGDVVGAIIISFPSDVAERIASIFVGMPVASDNPDFADAIGELINMVSGNAKAGFSGKKCSISCPSVVIGKGHQVFRQRDMPCIELPCSCNCGEFILEVALRDVACATNGSAAPGAQASAR